jgi:hypothetical protein
MATTRQYQIPGGQYVNETTDTWEYQIPGGPYLNETTAAAVGDLTFSGSSDMANAADALAGRRGLNWTGSDNLNA